MFKTASFSLLLALLLAVSLGCGDSDDSSTGPEYPTVNLADYVDFDTLQHYLLKVDDSQTFLCPEIYLWWEENFGEPFTDVNENGEYDPGIDIFIMGVGDDNMDLNHDGRYNGPDEPWEPGIPFDDIDGNDTCRQQSSYFSGYFGPPNVPYYDANGNGQIDSYLSYRNFVVRPVLVQETDTSMWWAFEAPDTVLYYVSDSGITYYVTLGEAYCAVCTHTEPLGLLKLEGQRLLYHVSYGATPYTSGLELVFELGPAAAFSASSERLPFEPGSDSGSYYRRITTGQTLNLDGVNHRDLLRVRCDQLQFGDLYYGPDLDGAFWEFYFSRENGIIAVYSQTFGDVYEPSTRRLFSFKTIADPLPLLLTK